MQETLAELHPAKECILDNDDRSSPGNTIVVGSIDPLRLFVPLIERRTCLCMISGEDAALLE
jgi:hypothetical protein